MALRRLKALTVACVGLVLGSAVVLSGVATYRLGGQYGERFAPIEKQIRRTYDPATGHLRVIAYDRNRNGAMDSWTYYTADERMSRSEADDDEDGVIDHWFYYDDAEHVVKMAFSTRSDGVPDAWWYDGPDSGMHRIEYVDRDNGLIVRKEYYDQGKLVQVDASFETR